MLANAIAALRHAPEWKGVLAHDEFASRVIAVRPVPWGMVPDGRWADHEDRLTAEWLQRHGILVPVEIAGQAVQTVAKSTAFTRYGNTSRAYDGTERNAWIAGLQFIWAPPIASTAEQSAPVG